MDKAKIDRINALARKAKAGPLTPEELAERDALRKEYLEAVRKNFRAQMDRIVIVEPDGTRHGVGTPIRRSAKTDAAGRRPFCLRSPAAGAAPCFPCRFLPKPLAFWAGFAIIFSLLGAAAVRGARRSSESRAGRAEKAARLTF